MQTKIKFKKKIITLIFLMISLLMFIFLGKWQINKYTEQQTNKDMLVSINSQPSIKIADVKMDLYQNLYKEITVRGDWDYENIQLNTNIVKYGISGKDILVPVNVDKLNILVNRGWAPDQLIAETVLSLKMDNSRSLKGRVYVPPEKKVKALSNNEWLGFSIESISKSIGYDLSYWMIVENAKIQIGDEYTRYSILPNKFPVNQNILVNNDVFHLGYAFTWFSFSILVIFGIIYVCKN